MVKSTVQFHTSVGTVDTDLLRWLPFGWRFVGREERYETTAGDLCVILEEA